MNCYLVEGAVILKYYITGNSICEKLSNMVMAASEEEAEYKFIKYYSNEKGDKMSTEIYDDLTCFKCIRFGFSNRKKDYYSNV